MAGFSGGGNAMSTLKMESTDSERGVRAPHAAPIIVATDGRTQSDAALIMGRLLGGGRDAMRLVSVVKPLPVVSPEIPIPLSDDVDAARRADARRAVVDQVKRCSDDAIGKRVDVEVYEGDPATVVARLAHDASAAMIVAGIGRHRVMDRVFGDETALRLIRLSDVPVLAAASGPLRAPRRIVVAIDFSETSLHAAQLALDVAAACATIYLAHVAPRDNVLFGASGHGASYKHDAGRALQTVRDQLRVPDDAVVEHVLLQGDPATELLAFAAGVNADLIATGSHGHGFVARMMIGSVATRLVRCSTCSVLTVPHGAATTRARGRVERTSVISLPRAAWTTELNGFARRNLGRRSTFEADDRAIGAQARQFDYPLLGASYDAVDQRVALVFGDVGDVHCLVSHNIGEVSAIDVMRDESGRDVALRIAHGAGHTFLHFSSSLPNAS
jgi:nucleotide-binding universal stress UspA family protein